MGQSNNDFYSEKIEFRADSILNKLTLKEKIGQIFMLSAYSNRDVNHLNDLLIQTMDYNIGGFIFFQGEPYKQVKMINALQKASKLPLWFGMDAEWGLSMRIKNTYAFPYALTVGAMTDLEWTHKMSQQIARHCKLTGIDINFAPDADLNTNLRNPIIGNRSFGMDKDKVVEHVKAYIQGHTNERVLTSIKHFPGHGDTKDDSHKVLPTIPYNRKRLDNIELYPFKKVLEEVPTPSVMVSHLNIPSLDTNNIPATISYPILTELLKDTWKYKGLIFTDALNMQGFTSLQREEGELEILSFLAGVDVLLMPQNFKKVLDIFHKAVKSGRISKSRLDESVKKILKSKVWLGLFDKKDLTVKHEKLIDLLTEENHNISQKIYEKANVLLKNRDSILPLKSETGNKYLYLSLGNKANYTNDFFNTLKIYASIDKLYPSEITKLRNSKFRRKYKALIIGVNKDSSTPWKSKKLSFRTLQILESYSGIIPTVLTLFASSFSLESLSKIENKFSSILLAHQYEKESQIVAAQQLFGALPILGALPIDIPPKFRLNQGITLGKKKNIVSVSHPIDVNINPKLKTQLDSLLYTHLDYKTFPAAQLLISKNNKIIYHNSVGYQSFSNHNHISNFTLFDLASITKVAATTMLIMKTVDKGMINLDDSLGMYFDSIPDMEKRKITIREILAHTSGLKSWIPFYKKFIHPENNSISQTKYFCKYPTLDCHKIVADSLFASEEVEKMFIDSIWESPLYKPRRYVYSDLGFILLRKILEKKFNQSFAYLLNKYFHNPMGMYNTTFNASYFYPKEQIAPSENDTDYRKQVVTGFVNDQSSSLQNGISGNAGLFSNMYDLSKLSNMLISCGTYLNKRILNEETIDLFNHRYYGDQGNRRGLGFDKLQLYNRDGVIYRIGSDQSFGHFGFTGTMMWIDPVEELSIIFLSNRTMPTPRNNKINSYKLRGNIQSLVYKNLLTPIQDHKQPYGYITSY